MDFIFVAIMGALWGSFANVCILRLPEGKGVVSGRSYCPNCKKLITWKDNIPIISFLLLKGKCRQCKKPISFQYTLVEFLSLISFLSIYYLYGISLTTLLLIILAIIFIIIFFIDLKHFIIPNSLTFPLMALGFIKSFIPIIFFYKQVRKKDGMGLGDAKLFAVIGFWFGWISIPFVIFLSSIIALLSVIPDLIKNSKKMTTQIPFGPYIIIGTLVYLLFENNFRSILF